MSDICRCLINLLFFAELSCYQVFTSTLEHFVLKTAHTHKRSTSSVQEPSTILAESLPSVRLCCCRSLIHLAHSLEEETMFSLSVFTSPAFSGRSNPAAPEVKHVVLLRSSKFVPWLLGLLTAHNLWFFSV